MDRPAGFTLIEVIFAIGVMLVVTSIVAAIVSPADAAFASLTESADVQQRLRVAADGMYRSLLAAGAGPHVGDRPGGLHMWFAPVLPFRRGAIAEAAPGSYATDTITVYSVPAGAVPATTSVPTAAAGGTVAVNADARCPRNPDGTMKPLCGSERGMSMLILDQAGRHDVF